MIVVMKLKRLFQAFAASLLMSGSVHAHHMEGTVHIYATGWGLTLKDDGTGFYSDLARFLLGAEMSESNYVVYPYRRAMRAFLADKDGCVYPKSIDSLYRTGDWEDGDHFLESTALIRSPIRIFTPEGAPVVAAHEDLAGKRLAFAMGSKIPKSLNADAVTFVPVADEVDKAKLLGTGTVDAIVANLPDAVFVFQSLGQPLPPYDPYFEPVPDPVVRIVCYDTPENRAFLQSFNARVEALTGSGELARFLEAKGLDAGNYIPR